MSKDLHMDESKVHKMPRVQDVMESEDSYREFYERVGGEYPETEVVHKGDPRRYNVILSELLPFASKGYRLLDIGCNDGVYTIPYSRAGGIGHGIDISSSLIQKARAQAEGLSATFEVADIEKYTSKTQYDAVLMSEVLEHVRNPEIAMVRALKALRGGGFLLLSAPTPYGLITTKRYIMELLQNSKLTEKGIVRTEETILGERYHMAGFHYRHDGYYPPMLRRWLHGLGLRTIRSYTAVYGRSNLFLRTLQKLETTVRIERMPVLNLFGETNVLLMAKTHEAVTSASQ